MYALERLVFQGTNICPQYQWKQFAVCDSRPILDKVRAGQKHPGSWRVVFLPCSLQEVMKNIPKAA